MAFVSLQRTSRRVARTGATISKWRRRVRIVRRALMVASVLIAVQRFLSDSGSSGGSGGGGRAAPPRPTPSTPRAPQPAMTSSAGGGRHDGVPVGVSSPGGRSSTPAASAGPEPPVGDTGPDERRWVAADEGTAPPDGFPVKVNGRSGIYHLPGGLVYDRTRPDRWYRTAADAEADGYRASKA